MAFPRRGQNPYLEGLYSALESHGINVLDDRRSYRLLSEGAPTFVHYHWPENAYGHHLPLRVPDRALWFFSRLWLQRAAGARVIWTFHNAAAHEDNFPALHAGARRLMVTMSDIVLVHFESAREHLLREYGRAHNVWLVPHGNYRGYYPSGISRSEARRELGLSDVDFVFLLFGDLRPYKNLELAIDAFQRLRAPHARLVIAGPRRREDYAAKIRARCAEDARIVLHDRHVPDEQVQWYFRSANFLLLPREVFSSGTCVLAFDFSLPVIAPKVHHIAELARGHACLPLASVDSATLTQTLTQALHTDLENARKDAERSTRDLGWNDVGAELARRLKRFAHADHAPS